MHDFSISQQIAHHVIRKVEEEKATEVLEIKIKIGELTHLNPEQLTFWLREFFRQTPASRAKILIEKTPPIIQCKKCKYEGKVRVKKEDTYLFYFLAPFTCPRCGSDEVEVISGRECLLERIKIKR